MEICQSTLCPGLRVSACVRHGAPYGRRVLCLRRVPRPLRTRRKLRTLWPPDHLRPPRNTPAPKETPLRIRRGASRCKHRHTWERRSHCPLLRPHGHRCRRRRRETPHVIAVFLVLGKTPECRLIVLEGLNPRRYVSSSFHVGVLVSLVSKCVFGSNCRM